VEYIESRSGDRPFFIYMPLTAPHTPVVPAARFKNKNSLGAYGDFCEEVDWCVGQVLNALDKKGLAENTLVIFTSDNGCAAYIGVKALEKNGHYPSYIYRGYKADIFEGGHRVPFLARWPKKVDAGTDCVETVCLTDLLATCAEITGVTLPDNAGEDSVSILPALLGKKSKRALREATVHHSINGSFSIRQGKWKLEMCPGSGGWGYPRPALAKKQKLPDIQLYDLSKDISEKNNVYKEHPEVVENLSKLLKKYILDGRSTPGSQQSYIIPKKWNQTKWINE
jgi:arylsulfatase A-like enzyme